MADQSYDESQHQGVTPDPMNGPFPTAGQLTDYSDDLDFAIVPQPRTPAVPRYFWDARAAVRKAYPTLDPAATDRKAWGIAQDYESAVLNRRTVGTMDEYAVQLADWGL